MVIAGLKTRFLTELIELYGEVLGPPEQQRLLGRLSERHQKWLTQSPLATTRPEFLFVDDVEELLQNLDGSVGGCSSVRFETNVTETMTRCISRQALTVNDTTLRGYLNRIVPLVEDCWPIRPPTITVEEVSTGLRITMALLGYSRCTRLLAFQLLAAVKYACRLANDSSPEEQHTTVDFFGDRARIDIHQRLSLPPNSSAENPSHSCRPSQRSVRLLRPSLSDQVESILGRRSTSIPAPQPPTESRPPTNALGMAQLRRPSQPGFEAPRLSTGPTSSPLASPRIPTFDAARRSTPPPSRLLAKTTTDAPSSRTPIETERPTSPSSSLPPSRRGGQPR